MTKDYHGLIEEFKKLREEWLKAKDSSPFISVPETKKLAQQYGLSSLEVEIAALQEKIIPTRYKRNIDTITVAEQITLLKSKVAVIGCGGLGGSIIELLARLGIGYIVVVDGDQFNESNLNRQHLSTEKNIGKRKAETAVKRIHQINSSIRTKIYSQLIDSSNVLEIIRSVQIVVDALDNISTRLILGNACRQLGIPIIHGAINGLYGQVSTIFPEDKGFEVIYSSSLRNKQSEKITQNTIPKPIVSTLSVTPAMVASFQVTEVMKVLLKKGKTLRNKLLLFNLEEMDWNVVEI